MALLVEWSPRSKQELFNLLIYLEQNWGTNKVNETIKSINELIEQIVHMPLMFPPISKRKAKIRYAVLTKQTTIIYKSYKMKIEIVSLFDTRQNPIKRNF